MKSTLLLLTLLLSAFVYGQNVSMNDSGTDNVSRCGNVFFDSGGNNGDYSNNENGVMTICPTTAGSRLMLTFTMFQTQNNVDIMQIYDGNNTSAPLLGTYSGGASPGIVSASQTNTSGCLTIRFTSNGSTRQDGWRALISCFVPCQIINSVLLSSTPAVTMPGGMIRACQGDNITFNGGGTFSDSGTGATYEWSFGDGTTASGTTVNHVYANGGSYLVNLTITDPNGCTNNNNLLNQLVQISTTPTIVTSATPSPLCTNQFSLLNAVVTPVTAFVNCTPPVSGTTFLPDGSGASYTTSIATDCYPFGSTIASASDFISVCMNIEHSYNGDLDINLVCPNGQSMILKNQGGGGTATKYLGAPLDDPTPGPGTGRVYCFTPTATTLLNAGSTSSAGSPSGNSIVAGDYRPNEAFSELVGCPLNGTWTIRITDNISQDNGYIFNWSLNLATGLTGIAPFTPAIVSQNWVPQTFLYPISSTQANVVASTQATHNFTYTVTDNFGCTYTAPQSVVVNCFSLPVELVSFEATALSDRRVEVKWVTQSELNSDRFEIDRSSDGQNWQTVTTVKAAGESQTELVYSILDSDPELGISYYRLRQYDMDGIEKVSDIDVVTINPEAGMLVVYPNPATDWLTIEGSDADLKSLVFLNSLGQDVTSMIRLDYNQPSRLAADLRELAKGTYMIKTPTTSYLVVKQ